MKHHKEPIAYAKVFQALPVSIRERAIKNLKREHKDKFLQVKCYVSDPLRSGFDWHNTPEGLEYWQDVHADYGRTLKRIIK